MATTVQTWAVVGGDPMVLGYWPDIFLETDPRPAVEQANDRYAHGGGWHEFCGSHTHRKEQFQLHLGEHAKDCYLEYPDDPPMKLIGFTFIHEDGDKPERILFFEHAWVVIEQVDGSWTCARMD